MNTMKNIAILVTGAIAFGTDVAVAAEPAKAKVKVTRAGAQPSAPRPDANFTGKVRVDTPFRAEAPGRAGGGIVTFEPGARTAWHSHPLARR